MWKFRKSDLISSYFLLHQVKSQTEMRKTPVSEARKTPVTQTPSQASSSQFIPIHHPGAFPPLPSRPGNFHCSFEVSFIVDCEENLVIVVGTASEGGSVNECGFSCQTYYQVVKKGHSRTETR